MFGLHRTSAAALLTAGLLMGTPTLQGQEFPKPVPTTAETDGSLITPQKDVYRAGPDDTTRVHAHAAQQLTPLTAEDVQTWGEISRLHEQFVRSQIGVASTNEKISRTDANRQRLQQLWERVAQIERLLILEATNSRPGDAQTIAITRPVLDTPIGTGPVPRPDLDLKPDPLTATNQGVPASGVERDKQTARSILQEDRSPTPDPVRPDASEAAGLNRGPVVAEEAGDTTNLWQEYVEIRREILLAEIAAARAVADTDK